MNDDDANAVSGDPASSPDPVVPGLTEPRTLALERFPIRTREGSVTLAGWRLRIESMDGPGTIALVELAPGGSVFRGEGVFLGWPQDRLASAYGVLAPRDSEPPFQTQQLG